MELPEDRGDKRQEHARPTDNNAIDDDDLLLQLLAFSTGTILHRDTISTLEPRTDHTKRAATVHRSNGHQHPRQRRRHTRQTAGGNGKQGGCRFWKGPEGWRGAPLFRVARPKTDERKKGRRRRRVGQTPRHPPSDVRRPTRRSTGRPVCYRAVQTHFLFFSVFFRFFSLFSLPCLCFRRCLLMALWCFREAGEGRQQGGGKHPGGAYLPALATTQT